MMQTATDHRAKTCPELLSLCKVDLYRRNLFRVLKVGIDVSPREVRRKQQSDALQKKYGKAQGNGQGGRLALLPAPNEEQERDALDRNANPLKRVMDEIFWFWPVQGGDTNDPALKLLSEGKPNAAAEYWNKLALSKSPDGVAAHNLAIFYHLLALDIDGNSPNASSSETIPQQLAELWKRTYSNWWLTLETEGFWDRAKQRVQEQSDPQITIGLVRRIRETLPKALLSLHASLALKAAELGKKDDAGRLIGILRDSPFPPSQVTEAIRESLAGVRDRMEVHCEESKAKAKSSPESAKEVIWELLDHVREQLKIVDLLLPLEDPVRQGICSQAAEAVLVCQIVFGNTTKDWEESLKMLEATLPLSGTASTRQRVELNLTIVRSNFEGSRCFFCRTGHAKDGCEHEMKMYGNVRRERIPGGYRAAWKTLELNLPRCTGCQKAMKRAGSFTFLAVISTLIVGVAIAITLANLLAGNRAVMDDDRGAPTAVIGCIASLVLAIVVGVVTFKIKNAGRRKCTDHERVKELTKEGWKFGAKPSDEECKRAPMSFGRI